MMRLIVCGAAVVAGCAISGCSPAGGIDRTPARVRLAEEPARLRGEWCGEYFMAECVINGMGPYRLLLDTGATSTLIDDDVARSQRSNWRSASNTMVGSAGERVRSDGSLEIDALVCGGVTLNGFDALVLDLERFTPVLGRIDGVLGYSAMQGTTFSIDYPERVVEVSAQRLGEVDERGFTQFRYGHALRPGVLVDVDGVEVKALVDSGSGATIAVPAFDELGFVSAPVVASVAMGVGSVSVDRVGRLAGNASIGDLLFLQPVVESERKEAMVGTDTMRHHRWTFDTRSRLVRVTGESTVHPVMEYSPGYYGAFEGGAYVVRGVIAGSDADAAGVEPGDELIAIDGRPLVESACRLPWFEAGGLAELTFMRGGQVYRHRIAAHDVAPLASEN